MTRTAPEYKPWFQSRGVQSILFFKYKSPDGLWNDTATLGKAGPSELFRYHHTNQGRQLSCVLDVNKLLIKYIGSRCLNPSPPLLNGRFYRLQNSICILSEIFKFMHQEFSWAEKVFIYRFISWNLIPSLPQENTKRTRNEGDLNKVNVQRIAGRHF